MDVDTEVHDKGKGQGGKQKSADDSVEPFASVKESESNVEVIDFS